MSHNGGSASEARSGTNGGAESPRDQLFTQFYEVTDFQEILSCFKRLCEEIGVDPSQHETLYPSLKRELTSWKCRALWELFDSRALLPEYENQKACEGKRVLVVGAGPVGLRAAIEAALLGAKVELVEKRPSFSRNNSLHLWPFLITDLRSLGAKKFYGKFASGTIDHICIRILQSILLKVCLVLGVSIHSGVTFTGLVEPRNTNSGWTITVNPTSCPVSSYNFDIVLSADGKQNSLPGFHSKEFRAKLALAITVNFVNHNTKQESSVPEISGVAYVYNQAFFNSLGEEHGIELENIVYYKDETHYFVMTAKKQSLLRKGVIKKDHNDSKQLLARDNISQKALEQYAIEAATFSTKGALGDLEFERNHRGEHDVALFDFTSLFAAENAARIVERKGKRILLCVVGDSLIEPFWPTGSGCARGFLGAFDAAWMMKRFAAGVEPMELLEEREAIYYLLPQTTPERLQKNLTGYTINPKTRYLNLSELVPPGDVYHLYDSDTIPTAPARNVNQTPGASRPNKEGAQKHPENKASRLPHRAFSVGGATSWLPKAKSIEGLAPKAETAGEREEEGPRQDRGTAAATKPAPSHSPKPWYKKDKPEDKATKPSPGEQPQTQKSEPAEKRSGFSKFFHSSSTKKHSPKSETRKVDTKRESSPVVSHSPKPESPVHKKKQTSPAPQLKPATQTASPPGRRDAKSKSPSPGHPLETATVAKQPRKGEESEPAPQRSVADIIKQLDPSTQEGAAGGKAAKHTFGSGKEDKSRRPSKGSKGKPDKKDKHSKEDHHKKEEDDRHKAERAEKEAKPKEKEPHSHWWSKPFSLLKQKKTYEVSSKQSAGISTSPKNRKKSKKEEKHVHVKVEPPSIQTRIEQLKRHGLEGVDASEEAFLLAAAEEEQRREIAEREGLPEREGDTEESQRVEPDSKEPSPTPEPVETSKDSQQQLPDEGEELESRNLGEKRESKEPEEEVPVVTEVPVVLERERSVEPPTSVEESIKRLEPFFEAKAAGPSWKTGSLKEKRSKEIDLAEIYTREPKEESSHPLWLARVIQGLNKCLEKLRKTHNVIVAKTALQILNTIFSNVQAYPEDDTYHRVRVSSERFHNKVWQLPEASQFLARAGWVEIDDFIVLPIGKNVDTPKRVLDKHLDIVNQMLWSMQLELPDSPAIPKRLTEVQNRGRSVSLCRRESYATRLVNESLETVERERMAIAAAKHRNGSSGGSSGSTRPPFLSTLVEGEEEGERERGREKESSPDPLELLSLRQDRAEEAQTMMAASTARNIWTQRTKKGVVTPKQEKEYRFILERELYDLPPSKSSRERSSAVSPHLLQLEPTRPLSPLTTATTAGRRTSEDLKTQPLPELPETEAAETTPTEAQGEGRETSPLEHDRGSPHSSSSSSYQRLSSREMLEATVAASESAREVWRQKAEDAVNSDPRVSSPSKSPPVKEGRDGSRSPVKDGRDSSRSPVKEGRDSSRSPVKDGRDSSRSPVKDGRDSSRSPDQERSPSPPKQQQPEPTNPAIGEGTTGEEEEGGSRRGGEGVAQKEEEEQVVRSIADVQAATESSIRSDIWEYEKIAMESAAQARQKWMQAQETSEKEMTPPPLL